MLMPVVGFDIRTQRILADGRSWGDVGPMRSYLVRFTLP